MTGLMLLVLESAKRAGISVTERVAWRWDCVPRLRHRRGNRPHRLHAQRRPFGSPRRSAMDEDERRVRVFDGPRADRPHRLGALDAPLFKTSADLVSRKPPRWDEARGSIDMDYWHSGTRCGSQASGSRTGAREGAGIRKTRGEMKEAASTRRH